VDRDLPLNFHGIPILQKGLVAPLADSINRGWNQAWVPTHRADRAKRAILSDSYLQDNIAVEAKLRRFRRSHRRDPVENLPARQACRRMRHYLACGLVTDLLRRAFTCQIRSKGIR
jgi:hypothetical protein